MCVCACACVRDCVSGVCDGLCVCVCVHVRLTFSMVDDLSPGTINGLTLKPEAAVSGRTSFTEITSHTCAHLPSSAGAQSPPAPLCLLRSETHTHTLVFMV